MDIYLISGLGADRSIFRNLTFSKTTQIHYLDWIRPMTKESLRSYALRMADDINLSVPFGIVGLSFGGMLATEMATVLHPKITVLVSSASTRRELPWYFRASARMGINRLIPAVKPNSVPRFISSVFGVETKEDHLFFQQLLRRTDPHFSKWAMDAIAKWERTERPLGIVRIHGSKDKVLPNGYGKVDYLIKGGGHFMIFNRANEISEILAEQGLS